MEHASEQRKRLFEAFEGTVGIVAVASDGTIRYVNDVFRAMTGYGPGELEGQRTSVLTPERARGVDRFAPLWARVSRGETVVEVMECATRDGRPLWLQATYSPVRDARGAVESIAVLASDVTAAQLAVQREEVERARLREENTRVRTALDGASTNLMIANERFEIIYMNRSLAEMLRENEAAIQKDLPQFRVDGLLGTNIDRFHRVPAHQRQVLTGLNGKHGVLLRLGGRAFELNAAAANDTDGRRVGYTVEWNDVTLQVTAQEEVQRVLEAATAGDLTQRIDSARFTGRFRAIADSINALLDPIDDAFRHIKLAVDQTAQASSELRSTSQLMSAGAEALNVAARRSSGLLVRASEMARGNAANAGTANELVARTAGAAREGHTRMEEMNAAMREVDSPAPQIPRILRGID